MAPRAEGGRDHGRPPHVRVPSEKPPVDAARTYLIEREQWLARPIEEVFAFYGDATNLEAITPAWLRFFVITPAPIAMRAGTLIEYRLRWRRMPLRWTTIIEAWEPPHRFVDTQLQGPYRLWHHTHTFEAQMGGTLIRDEVRYRLPLGWLGVVLHRLGIRRDLEGTCCSANFSPPTPPPACSPTRLSSAITICSAMAGTPP